MYSSGGASIGSDDGGPGTAFVYHLVHHHRTLIIDNDFRQAKYSGPIDTYHDLSKNSFTVCCLQFSNVNFSNFM